MNSSKITLSTLAFALVALTTACGGGGDDAQPQATARGLSAQTAALDASLQATAAAPLSADEARGLVFMREEEKLARDVYAALLARWNLTLFRNIGASEQAHMDSVGWLLTRYALADPAAGTLPGQFADPSLQALHDALLARGLLSPVDALQVGAEIEEVDIRDLRAIQATVDNADLLLVYANLERGSRNHLRAFHLNLQREGLVPVARVLTQAEYDAIVQSPHEGG